MVMNLSSPPSSYRWQVNLAAVEKFRQVAAPEENARLEEALLLIPSNALFTW